MAGLDKCVIDNLTAILLCTSKKVQSLVDNINYGHVHQNSRNIESSLK